MGDGKIIVRTDNKWRQFKYGYEVPKKAMAREFDYLEDGENDDHFMYYRKNWYHLSGFERVPSAMPGGWDGYAGDSFFSGILVKVSKDGERYKIGTYFA